MTTLTRNAPPVNRHATSSTLPRVDGTGLSRAEREAVTAARNDAEYRAARFADDNADTVPAECGRVAARVALRAVLAKRPAAVVDADDTTDYATLAYYGIYPVSGGAPDDQYGESLALDRMERGLMPGDFDPADLIPDNHEIESRGSWGGYCEGDY